MHEVSRRTTTSIELRGCGGALSGGVFCVYFADTGCLVPSQSLLALLASTSVENRPFVWPVLAGFWPVLSRFGLVVGRCWAGFGRFWPEAEDIRPEGRICVQAQNGVDLSQKTPGRPTDPHEPPARRPPARRPLSAPAGPARRPGRGLKRSSLSGGWA